MRPLISLLALAVPLSGCRGDVDEPRPEFAGGGFIHDDRLASADHGFVLRRVRTIPEGTLIAAGLEGPAGGPPAVLRQTAGWTRLSYSFRAAPVRGMTARRDYRVEVRLIDPVTREVLARGPKSLHADVDQSILPAAPPVTGPDRPPRPGSS